mmetsp:Transcript_19474/g.24524  ORF Transcript_19474/g.24524 Transcript_19474/m.24524 type:complete len:268 (+) Transcript_19474:107-910(+)
MKQQSPLATVTCLSIALVAFFSVQVDVTAFSNYVSYPNLKYARESATLHGRRGGNDEVTGYVPSGLTAEQYAKIKKAELDKKKKMDYGAWGPNFAKTGRPDGDWMVVPSLWTSGFSSNSQYPGQPQPTDNLGPEGGREKNIAQKFIFGLKRNVSTYAYAALVVEMVATIIHIISAQSSLSLVAIVQHQIKKRTANALVSLGTFAKLTCAKMIIAGLLVKPINVIVEKLNRNRRLMWSPRRTMTYGFVVSLTMLLITAFVKNFGVVIV